MIDRRRLLLTAAAGAGLATAGQAIAGPAQAGAGAQLRAVMDKIVAETLMTSPELLTQLGFDRGPNAPMKARLDDRSQAKVLADRETFRGQMTELKAVDRAGLNAEEAVWYDSLEYFGDTAVSGYDFPYGGGGFGPSPYTVSQLTGAYQSVPDFLDSVHSIDTAEDAEAYLSRVSAFATALDQETERMGLDFAAGAVPPDFVIAKTLAQMQTLMANGATGTTLVQSVVRRTGEKSIPGEWGSRAEAIVNDAVFPALSRQADALRAVQAGATHDAGVWRLPNGEAFYRYGIQSYTTTNLSGDEIHEIGMEQLAELSARADVLLRAQGLTQGSVGARIAALGDDPQYLYPNTDEAKEQLLRDLNTQTEEVRRRMPQYFGRLPQSGCEIRRVPVAIEAGAPGGYYNAPSLDGSRPGAYYINLRDTAEWPKFQLPTLTYHEAVPGHHHQIALAQERTNVPLLMKVLGFSAYSEGWALYAEQLADEIGMYENDPIGQIGYLQSLMFRATRLVVDSGMHAKRWSREQAIRFMVDALGDAESAVTTEIERYCVWPGQACSYKLGHTKWVELRANAQAALGDRFDIRAFHDAGMNTGGVPLTVLERVMTEWTAAQAA
jgi:uncharacterized protein (DUF885 family)